MVRKLNRSAQRRSSSIEIYRGHVALVRAMLADPSLFVGLSLEVARRVIPHSGSINEPLMSLCGGNSPCFLILNLFTPACKFEDPRSRIGLKPRPVQFVLMKPAERADRAFWNSSVLSTLHPSITNPLTDGRPA